MAGTATRHRPEHRRGQDARRRRPRRSRRPRRIVIATGSSTIEIPTFKFDGKQIIGAQGGREPARGAEAPARHRRRRHRPRARHGLPEVRLASSPSSRRCRTSCPASIPSAPKVVERSIVKHGGTILKNAKALGYEKQSDGSLAVKIEIGGQARDDRRATSCSSRSACARTAKGLGLEKVGVKVDERGFVPTDKLGRTNVAGDLRDRRRQRPAAARAQGDEGGRGRRRGHRRPQGGEGLGRDPGARSSPIPRSPPPASPRRRRRRRASRSASASSRSPRSAGDGA